MKKLTYTEFFRIYGPDVMCAMKTVIRRPPEGMSLEDVYQEICLQVVGANLLEKYYVWVNGEKVIDPVLTYRTVSVAEVVTYLGITSEEWYNQVERWFLEGKEESFPIPVGGNPFDGTGVYLRSEILDFAEKNYNIGNGLLKSYLKLSVSNRAKNILRNLSRRLPIQIYSSEEDHQRGVGGMIQEGLSHLETLVLREDVQTKLRKANKGTLAENLLRFALCKKWNQISGIL